MTMKCFWLQIHYPTTIETEWSTIKLSGKCPPEEMSSPCTCHCDVYEDLSLLIDCERRQVSDDRISEILNVFLNDETLDPLRTLRLDYNYNYITKIPEQLKLFPEFQELYLYASDIKTITTGSLTFQATEKVVGLGYDVRTIEPGAFEGAFYLFYLLSAVFLTYNYFRQLWQWLRYRFTQ